MQKIPGFICLLFASGLAYGNDSTARIGTTGIELVKTDSIVMRKELLTISQREIKVEYDFYNQLDKPIETLIAFPMPVYGFDLGLSQYYINNGPIKNFTVFSDGVQQETQAHYKAWLNEREISAELAAAGLTREQMYITFADCKLDNELSCNIPDEKIEQLKKIGAYTNDWQENKVRYPLGAARVPDKYGPTWDVEQTLAWTQKFNPKKITTIVHTYQPLVGGIYNLPIENALLEENYQIQAASIAKDNAEACIDEAFKRAYNNKLNQLKQAGAKNVMVMLNDVEYVLGTGRNWSGPIQDFTLRIKKENKDQLVSLCFPGKPLRVDPLTLEFKHKNFVPQDKLVVYFYSFIVK